MLKWLRGEFYLILAFMLFTVYISTDSFLPAMQPIADGLGTTITNVNLSFPVTIFGGFIIQIPIGLLSEKIGRRPIILMGALIFMVSTFFISHTTTIETFMICRLFQGIGGATIYTTARTIVSEYYEYQKRVSAMAMVSQLSVIAPMVGPLVGTSILSFHGDQWQYIYIYNYILFAVLFILAILVIPETLPALTKKESASKTENTTKDTAQDNKQEQGASSNPDPDADAKPNQDKTQTILDILKVKSFLFITLAMTWRVCANTAWICGCAKIIMIDLNQSQQVFSYAHMIIFSSLVLGNIIAGRFGKILPSKYIRYHVWVTSIIIVILFIITMLNYNLYYLVALMFTIALSSSAITPITQSIVVTEIQAKGLGMSLVTSIRSLLNIITSTLVPLMYFLDSRWIVSLFIVVLSMSVFFTFLALPHIKRIERNR